jgi:4-alpha-glucanotransferase
MRLPRSAGILLHPTALPGRYGIGDLGGAAFDFVDFLAGAKLGVWQVLPLGPTGFGDSPYQCSSVFGGNPLLISPDKLRADGLLTSDDIRSPPQFSADRVDFGPVILYKRDLLQRAARRFKTGVNSALATAFEIFRRAQASWLNDYALFMAVKEAHKSQMWTRWEPGIARRTPAALLEWRMRLAEAVIDHQLFQFLFFRQWRAVKQYANERGIRIMGDVPIFVAHDSADVWSHRDLFFVDDSGELTEVAGVPPDLFSATGQLWGNPLYRWDAMAAQQYSWWIDRLRATFAQVDMLRIDHFIGFTRSWHVRAGEPTATKGRWVPGPGVAFGYAMRDALGTLPIIAEDLGLVTLEVDTMRDELELPGMKVLQFAFDGDAANHFLPHNYTPNYVVYTGTHDNDTTVGWFRAAVPGTRAFAQRYLARSGEDIAYDLIRAAMSSVADTAIFPLQDVFALGSEARMNFPGRPAGNWSWRYRAEMLGVWHRDRLREMVELYGRVPDVRPRASRPTD